MITIIVINILTIVSNSQKSLVITHGLFMIVNMKILYQTNL